ncbi:hypothetical protein GCM10010425_50540 [Streptomyces spororaveus]|uniref:Secreted protein n=1 Tax=Streptomyces spororaveus TaxID=284039 RepID=A0ABQ3T2M8_9ACTN|nr:hypothetical protein [Streptomyces spororaveus]GHI74648.1 hypothetical protein Sspor_02090 [Streptomyces spororaveus]
MTNRTSRRGPEREHLIAYMAVLATVIALIALGVTPTAILPIGLGMGLMYEKWADAANRRRGSDGTARRGTRTRKHLTQEPQETTRDQEHGSPTENNDAP